MRSKSKLRQLIKEDAVSYQKEVERAGIVQIVSEEFDTLYNKYLEDPNNEITIPPKKNTSENPLYC